MHYTISKNNYYLVVSLTGELDISATDSLRNDVDKALGDNASVNLIFDLSGVSFIDSAGLGVILGRYKKVSAAGGRVYLAGAGPQVRKILELSGLLNLMDNYPSLDEVLKQIS